MFWIFSGQGSEEVDGACTSGSARIASAIAHLNNKIARTRNLIRLEQTIRDGKYTILTHVQYTLSIFICILYIFYFSENVNEYLKLSTNADKQQLQRIKAVFEKKNQKSAHSVQQLQKKIDGYEKRIKNWEVCKMRNK